MTEDDYPARAAADAAHAAHVSHEAARLAATARTNVDTHHLDPDTPEGEDAAYLLRMIHRNLSHARAAAREAYAATCRAYDAPDDETASDAALDAEVHASLAVAAHADIVRVAGHLPAAADLEPQATP